LAELGWADGRNVRIEYRFGGGDATRMRLLAKELFELRPDVKRMMAQQFEDAGGDVSLGGTINRLLVEDRNKACIKVLQQQLTA
jgi:hypothetical protein